MRIVVCGIFLIIAKPRRIESPWPNTRLDPDQARHFFQQTALVAVGMLLETYAADQ